MLKKMMHIWDEAVLKSLHTVMWQRNIMIEEAHLATNNPSW